MARAQPTCLEGSYIVLIKNRLQANGKTDPAKWALWKVIWESTSFEQLAAAPEPVNTPAPAGASPGALKPGGR